MKAKYIGEYWKQDILQGYPNDPKEEELLKIREAASDRATEENLVNYIITFPVGDGLAKYVVIEDNLKVLSLAHLNEGDNWHAHLAIIKSITRTQIVNHLRFYQKYKRNKTTIL